MDITPYVEHLRRDLVAAAEMGSDEVKAAAERLALALEPATRLALMEALSAAADEVTAELPTGSVDVRLDGRDLRFVVTSAAPPPPPAPPAPPAPDELDDGTLARITLRIPESVKLRAEDLAARSGTSLNTWLVTVVRTATSADQALNVDIDLSSLPFLGGDPFRRPTQRNSGRRMTGWV